MSLQEFVLPSKAIRMDCPSFYLMYVGQFTKHGLFCPALFLSYIVQFVLQGQKILGKQQFFGGSVLGSWMNFRRPSCFCFPPFWMIKFGFSVEQEAIPYSVRLMEVLWK